MEQDLVDLLVAEHRRIESLFADIETAGSPAARRAALDAAVTVLAAHTATEERLLHPHLPAELAEYEAAEHRRIEELMARLAGSGDAGPGLDALLAALLETVREHVQEEETELFPRLPQSVRVTE